jgi:ATP-dependent RNA helicase DeaD
MSAQLDLLNTGPQIIIGTPGRILDHLYRGSLALRNLRYLVLDEADQMLDAGFGQDVERILDTTSGRIQMALFSATVPTWVHEVISHRLHEPAFIKVDEEQRGPNESVDHTVIEVTQGNKLEALSSLLNERGNGNVVIFCRTKIGVERLERQLSGLGYGVASLQGNQNQMQRERVLRGFRRGNPPIMVATNVAARGLDILAIEQVINYDVPENAELLTHRLGRTGRMGRHGSAVTLLTPAEGNKWKAIERQIGVRVERERFGAPPVPKNTPVEAAGINDPSSEVAKPPAEKPRERSSNRPRSRAPRQRYDATCAQCGQQTTVSFVPQGDRPVYCNTCFRERKDTTAA